MRKLLSLLSILPLTLAAPDVLNAQDAPLSNAAESAPAEESQEGSDGNTLSFEFVDMPPEEMLHQAMEQYGASYFLPSSARLPRGNITLVARDLTEEAFLEVLLPPLGFGYERKHGIITIQPESEQRKDHSILIPLAGHARISDENLVAMESSFPSVDIDYRTETGRNFLSFTGKNWKDVMSAVSHFERLEEYAAQKGISFSEGEEGRFSIRAKQTSISEIAYYVSERLGKNLVSYLPQHAFQVDVSLQDVTYADFLEAIDANTHVEIVEGQNTHIIQPEEQTDKAAAFREQSRPADATIEIPIVIQDGRSRPAPSRRSAR